MYSFTQLEVKYFFKPSKITTFVNYGGIYKPKLIKIQFGSRSSQTKISRFPIDLQRTPEIALIN